MIGCSTCGRESFALGARGARGFGFNQRDQIRGTFYFSATRTHIMSLDGIEKLNVPFCSPRNSYRGRGVEPHDFVSLSEQSDVS